MEALTQHTLLNDSKCSAAVQSSHWGDVSHGGQHRNATVLDLGSTTSLEVLDASVGGKSGGIPETNRRLHAQLVLEGGQVDLYDRAAQF